MGGAQAGGQTADEEGRQEHGEETINRKRGFEELSGLAWKTFFLFFFFVSLFSDVETTQCEEEDRSRQDTETKRHTSTLSSTRSERETAEMAVVSGRKQTVAEDGDARGMEAAIFCSIMSKIILADFCFKCGKLK